MKILDVKLLKHHYLSFLNSKNIYLRCEWQLRFVIGVEMYNDIVKLTGIGLTCW